MHPLTLNRRHRAGLFLVLVATGLSLFLEASAKQTAGVVLIGLAATWLVGGLSIRALGILCSLSACTAGFSIAGIPLWEDWRAWQSSFKQYTAAIEDLRSAITSAPVNEGDWRQISPPVPPGFYDAETHYSALGKQTESDQAVRTKIVVLPESAQKWKRPNRREEGGSFPSETPGGIILAAIERDFLVPLPTFSLSASFRLHLVPVLVGLALAAAGLSSCGWYVRSVTRAKRGQAAAL